MPERVSTTAAARFLRYVTIDTQSDEQSQSYPSTTKQLVLLSQLVTELHTLGIVWRFKKSKGFDYAEDFTTYQVQTRQALNRDGGRPRISTGPAMRERIPVAPQVPDTLVV